MPPILPPKIALVAASRVELTPIVKRFALKWRASVATGSALGMPVYALATGVGRHRARQKVGSLLRQERLRLLIHLGFAGALDPALEAGELLHVRTITSEDGVGIEVDSSAAHRLITVDRIADSPKAKAALRDKHSADAVDMESSAVARLAAEHGVPYLPLRAVSDTADMALPIVAARWVLPDGSTSLRAISRHVLGNPRDVALLKQLHHNTKLAGDALLGAVEGRLAELAGEAPA